MTYRAVPRNLPLYMAGDAESHAVHVIHLEHLRHALNFSMTGPAGIRAQSLDMPLMREMGVPRQVVDPNPLDRLLLGPRLAQLPDLCLVGAISPADDQVAAHAGLHRRNARLGGYVDGIVAVLTLNFVLAGVNVVAEEDWLARPAQGAAVRGGDKPGPG